MKATLITDGAMLEAIAPEWEALWRRGGGTTPFSSPAWLLPWWEVFKPGDLFTVAVRHDDRLVALAPLYREDGPWGRRLLPLGISVSDYSDVLIDPDHREAAGAALLDLLQDHHPLWDLWSAEEAPPDAAVLTLPWGASWTATIEPHSACPVLMLPRTVADLPAAIPARTMRKWRMAQNRIGRRAWRIERAEPGHWRPLLDDLFGLHQQRWISRNQPGVLADADVRRFHERAVPRLLEAGLLRLSRLSIDDRVAGAYYGFDQGSRSFAYIGGFDPAFAFESPGTILLGAAIEAATHRGASEFHFLRGQELYKYGWGAVDRWNQRLTMKDRA
ncbi:GNAT family N-acetyltransferase [Lichenihabitans psoromatis]|uniref:GNAT family N-acetyltransferase n=1 Tax=Lichenihabitans psoromatis TaxID=2528642 RepID=UPI001038490B|nr:GNAT family N-acetyltransferase [Lichenihabitans psoromatis]